MIASRAWGRRSEASLADSARAAVLPYICTRAIVLTALFMSRFLVSHLHLGGTMAARVSHGGLLAWDASYYRSIAEVGYARTGEASLRFFPLLPIAGRALALLPGVSRGAAIVVIANVTGFLALVALHALVSRESLGEGTPERSVWVLSLWPAAFVLVMGYPEALFLLLSILAFACWRARLWWWSVLPAYLAALCRPTGILLALPALVEVVLQWRAGPHRELRDHAGQLAALLAVPAGTVTYLSWVGVAFGDFFKPYQEQLSRANRGGFADPFVTFARLASDLARGVHLGSSLHAPFAILCLALTIYLFFRLPASYGCYAAVTMLVAITAPNLDSLERYALACFPLAVALGCLTERRLAQWLVFSVAGALLAAVSLLAFLGIYVP